MANESPPAKAGPVDASTPPPPAAAPTALGRARRIVRIVFAFTLLILGIIGIILPLIPGWPLALVGLSILAAEYVWARRFLARIRRRGDGRRST